MLLRQVVGGRVAEAVPATVVDGSPTRMAFWVAPRTECRRLRGTSGRRVLPLAQWTAAEHTWFGNGNLIVVRPGDAFALMRFWEDAGAFAGWYVNLQDPVRVHGAFVDSRDHALDVWIPARGTPRLKDEDHLEGCVAVGVFTADEARRIWARAADVIARRAELLPTGFEAFRPDPAWPVPELPAGWDRISRPGSPPRAAATRSRRR